jgi:hypothetical protein
MNKFPTDEKLILILCDDFRHEGNGKMSMFGLYGDNLQVVLPLDQTKVVLESLGVYAAFRDGEGKFKMTVLLTAPNDKTLLPPDELQLVEKKSNGWMNIALKLVPFNGEIGDYTLKISLQNDAGEKREYTRNFTIGRQSAETKH